HDGFVPGSAAAPVQPELREVPRLALSKAALSSLEPAADELEITFAADCKVYDGRFANNAWLQELPEPVMKLTWDNAAFISPKTAAALGVEDSTLITLTLDNRSITLPALMSPGQAPGSIRVVLGYGRTAAGVVAGSVAPRDADPVDPVGVSVYPLR